MALIQALPSRNIRKLVYGLFGLCFVFACSLALSPKTQALSGSEFNAGNIIDNSIFFNGSSMSAEEVQNFLNLKVPSCDTNGTKMHSSGQTRAQYGASRGYPAPYTCLKNYSQNTPNRSAETGLCNAYTGGVKSGAQIINDVAKACGVSPKVLIVLLQKEQSLITDDWPWSVQYEKATGFACPDTAPCDPAYAGFFYQVYNAARQFKKYARDAGNYNYRAQRNNSILYHPNAACGSSTVYIENQATAGLYVYTPYRPNQAALNNLYGTGDGCSAYGNRNFWRLFRDWFGATHTSQTVISYKSHLSDYGWTGATQYSGVTGTTGQSRGMEAFKINGEVEYSSYNFNTGWQPTINKGMISGTTGRAKSIQAVKIKPLGSVATKYDLYYRAYVSDVGWMDWAKNGATAGVTGENAKKIEALEIQPVTKGAPAPGSTSNPYQNSGIASYAPVIDLTIDSHVSDVGWQPSVRDDMVTGTTEQNKAIEAIKINVSNHTDLSGSITYSAHLANKGWQGIKLDGEIAGTTGEARQMEAIRMNLTGEMGENYDIWYRAHVSNIGWLNWAKNGSPAGSVGAARKLEAVEVRIATKDSLSLPQGALYNPAGQPSPDTYTLTYAAHLRDIGWVGNITQNNTGGTTGQSRPMEALKFKNTPSMFGDIIVKCSAYVKGVGWSPEVAPESTCGTTGQSKPIRAVVLSLDGDAAARYSIQYKVHLSGIGWQNWVTDGDVAGTTTATNSIEAITIRLVKK